MFAYAFNPGNIQSLTYQTGYTQYSTHLNIPIFLQVQTCALEDGGGGGDDSGGGQSRWDSFWSSVGDWFKEAWSTVKDWFVSEWSTLEDWVESEISWIDSDWLLMVLVIVAACIPLALLLLTCNMVKSYRKENQKHRE